MEVADVEPADSLLSDLVVADVAIVAADPLVAAGAERFVPAPVKITAPTSMSSRARPNASRSSAIVCGRNAFRTSGRLIVIFASPSARS